MKELQPWAYVQPQQFKFLNDVIGSHEWADMSKAYHESQLQDLLDWGWNLINAKGKSAAEAKAELFSPELNFKNVEKYIDQKTNNPKQFLVKVGDHVFLKNDSCIRKIEITKVSVDLACPYGGVYPIYLEFFEIGRHGHAGEQDSVWVNVFGFSPDNSRIMSGIE